MGVPKFFRWISERYPCLSELVKEYQIPEFDNLYLDMNGIIHTCSHPNDFDPHFRITEEKIFKDIFHYIEILFRMIQPQKLFFMAVDGVAPRAKQNQQRGRRFRSAKEAEELEKKAREKGEELPSAARFDSNCITPGTPFMVRLQAQLKFFVAYKISTDDLWQKCQIILSGHETPGEGEHKIMDYIRYMKSQPEYDSNTRHCLYGLDADLIMLGLCSHEPHFSLLREEVRFDKKSSNQRITTPEETTFFLLHLSLMREYLEHEFSPVKAKMTDVGFEFDVESIIDDWVLMGFLVGNDFIPPLPELHINTGALPILYKTYMDVLPTLGGYINEGGKLNLLRFQMYMAELGKFDTQQFDEKFADLQYFKAKTGRRPGQNERTSYKKKNLSAFELDDDDDGIGFKYGPLEPEKPKNRDLAQLIAETDELLLDGPASDCEMSPYDESSASEEETLIEAEFRQHKQDYYMNKLEYKEVTREVLRSQAEGYVRAVQWNLNYYYNGVCSWSWFYPHHYSPYISDIRDFENMKLEFDMGQPFLPFQQLAAVLPAASKELLPEAYQWLMVEAESPIIHYYPTDFGTDLNGKRQEWEAVVLIPFIDETDLLSAMASCDDRLTSEERARNTHGPMALFEFSDEDQGAVEAPEYFPVIAHSHAKVTLINREDIFVETEKLVKGLCPGTRLDVFFPGFPTLKHVKHSGKLAKGKVKVFEMPARGENMLLTITPLPPADLKDIATEILGHAIYVQWPHLTEALVTSVWSSDQRCDLIGGEVKMTALSLDDLSAGRASRKAIAEDYANRRGVVVGDIPILLRAQPMIGRKYTVGAQATVTLEKQWAANSSPYALQATVRDIAVNDATFVRFKTVTEVFPVGSVCFMLTPGSRYGHMGEVIAGSKAGRIKLRLVDKADADLEPAKKLQKKVRTTYMQGSAAGARLGISSFLMSRVTGNLFISLAVPPGEFASSQHRPNIGLSLKFTKRNEEIPGYTRRDVNGSGWLYSQKAVELVDAYMEAFPKLFDYLSSHTSQDDFKEEDIFPGQEGQVAAIVAWMKQQPFTKVERQTCGSNCLESEVVEAIEAALDVEATLEQRTMLQVKPHLLYKPELHTGNLPPDLTATYALFDRVINVRKSFTVPLGLKGVVIGIHKQAKEEETLYDVVYDAPFPGGLTLGTSAGRSYRMPRCALINISHGKRFEDGLVESSDVLNAAFASVNRSRPLPVPRVFENAGINGVPRPLVRNQQQNWRMKGDTAPATPPSYTLLSKSKPGPAPVVASSPRSAPETWRKEVPPSNTDFTAMWEAMVAGGDQQQVPVIVPITLPITVPIVANKPRKVTEMRDAMGPSGDQGPPPASKKPAKAKAAQGGKAKPADLGTDALKMMLGIPAPKAKPANSKPAPQPAMTPVLVQDVFRHHAVEGTNPSTRLLTAFQAQGAGIPRYTYTDCAGVGIRATVLLPNGRVYTGPPAPTRQEASFGAAQMALDKLGSEPSPPRTAVVDLPPPPPHQWWQQPVPQTFQPPPFPGIQPAVYQLPPNALIGPMPYFIETPRAKPMVPARALAPTNKAGNYGPFPQPTAHFSPTKPFSPSHVAFSSPTVKQHAPSQAPAAPTAPAAPAAPAAPKTAVASKQQKASTQRLIRVTGAPPAPRERSTTPTKDPEGKPQVAMGVGRGAVPSSKKKPNRIAANFKIAKKVSKQPPHG